MDGNLRWSIRNSCSLSEGYLKGMENAINLLKHCLYFEIPTLTIFAFSDENWNRPESILSKIMYIIHSALVNKISILRQMDVKINFIGDLSKFPPDILNLISKVHQSTIGCDSLILNVALGYGARQEMTEVVRKIIQYKFEPHDITYQLIQSMMYTNSDPDLLIRTGGEKRLSNFLLMNLAYTELYFSDKLWPDFSFDDLREAIDDFNLRKRRYGAGQQLY